MNFPICPSLVLFRATAKPLTIRKLDLGISTWHDKYGILSSVKTFSNLWACEITILLLKPLQLPNYPSVRPNKKTRYYKHDSGNLCKATLVLKGFQSEKGIDYTEISSSLVKLNTIKTILGIYSGKEKLVSRAIRH